MTASRQPPGWRVPLLGILLVLLTAGLYWHQPISDWVRLWGYTPSPQVTQLAVTDGFTTKSDHLYYINRPVIVAKTSFTRFCNSYSEQTIILGCYHGTQNGIYVLQIANDSRLNGVMQVTAAHEMLHAAYDRLSGAQRKQIDGWLEDYYQHDLTDVRIKATIAAYQKSEPDAVPNEMHSVFGTEAPNLPPKLENYYKQYFASRQKVVQLAASYQAAFTDRQRQIAGYDARLKDLKQQIQANEASLDAQVAELKTQASDMERLRRGGQTTEYNSRVNTYNQAVSSYNQKIDQTKSLISEYNQLVEARNKIAQEQQQLVQELSGNNLSTIH